MHRPAINSYYSRLIESDLYRGFCADETTLRDLPREDSLNGEPVLRTASLRDGEISVMQEEAISTSPNIQTRRNISSQEVAVYDVYATKRRRKYGMVWHQPL